METMGAKELLNVNSTITYAGNLGNIPWKEPTTLTPEQESLNKTLSELPAAARNIQCEPVAENPNMLRPEEIPTLFDAIGVHTGFKRDDPQETSSSNDSSSQDSDDTDEDGTSIEEETDTDNDGADPGNNGSGTNSANNDASDFSNNDDDQLDNDDNDSVDNDGDAPMNNSGVAPSENYERMDGSSTESISLVKIGGAGQLNPVSAGVFNNGGSGPCKDGSLGILTNGEVVPVNNGSTCLLNIVGGGPIINDGVALFRISEARGINCNIPVLFSIRETGGINNDIPNLFNFGELSVPKNDVVNIFNIGGVGAIHNHIADIYNVGEAGAINNDVPDIFMGGADAINNEADYFHMGRPGAINNEAGQFNIGGNHPFNNAENGILNNGHPHPRNVELGIEDENSNASNDTGIVELDDIQFDMREIFDLFAVDYPGLVGAWQHLDAVNDPRAPAPRFIFRCQADVKAFLWHVLEMYNMQEHNLMFNVEVFSLLMCAVMRGGADKRHLLKLIKAFLNNDMSEVFRIVDFREGWEQMPDIQVYMDDDEDSGAEEAFNLVGDSDEEN